LTDDGAANPASRAIARTYSAREIGAAFVCLIGVAIIGSGLVVNPWIWRLAQGPYVVDKADVLAGYFLWSMILGAGVVALGIRVGKTTTGSLDGAVALALPLVFLVLADRLLLVHFGLPLWTHDSQLHYRQRPDTVRTLARAGRPRDLIQINRHGFHDTDFPIAKPPNEFRGVMIGDSVTMGDQVTYAETFSAQLEGLLAETDRKHASHQIINAGVHGYATYQELQVLRESLRFEPDFIAIGFCMNDVTEPSVVQRGFDEAGVDYHGVWATSNPIRGYILNDTGIGRLSQAILARSKTLGGERFREKEAVRQMAARTRDDPEVAAAWSFVASDLEAMYAIAKERDLEIVLIIFPYTFQLADPGLRAPQAILTEHAAQHGVSVIDFVQSFSDLIYEDGALLSLLRERGFSKQEIADVFAPRTRRYFLDSDHLTEAGHRVVAERLLEHLLSRGLVGVQTEAGSAPRG
jgi:lysophospholipase L1-like esterase